MLRRVDLTGEHHRSERWEGSGLANEPGDQHQRRRHRVPERDQLVLDESDERGAQVRLVLGHERDAGTPERREVQVEHRQVEMQRRVARQPVVGAHPDPRRTPLDEGQRVAVGEHHALRRPSRPGRVEDVGQILLGHRDTGIESVQVPRDLPVGDGRARELGFALGPRGGSSVGWVVERHDEARPVLTHRAQEPRRPRRRGDDRADRAVPRHGGGPQDRLPGIEWHVRGSRLHRPVDGRDRLEVLGGEDPDPIPGPDAAVDQGAGDAVRRGLELTVGERPAPRADGLPIRARLRRRRQQMVQEEGHDRPPPPARAQARAR